MSLVRDDYRYLALGLVLVAVTSACNDLATVPYNAMLRQLSNPQTSGRVSGLGYGLGFLGSVVLLLLAYFGFVSGAGDHRGLLGLPAADGQNVRVAMLFHGGLVSGCSRCRCSSRCPVRNRDRRSGARWWDSSPDIDGCGPRSRAEWRRDRNIIYYLIASAVFRDGLTGVFTFGGVLGVGVYGVLAGRRVVVRGERQRRRRGRCLHRRPPR